jgi:hypothetical protein
MISRPMRRTRSRRRPHVSVNAQFKLTIEDCPSLRIRHHHLKSVKKESCPPSSRHDSQVMLDTPVEQIQFFRTGLKR